MSIKDLVKKLKKEKIMNEVSCKPCGMYQTYFEVPNIVRAKAKEFNRLHMAHTKSKWNKFLERFFGIFWKGGD